MLTLIDANMLFVLNIMNTNINGFTIKLESGGVSLQKGQTQSSRRQTGEKSRHAAEFPVNERCPAVEISHRVARGERGSLLITCINLQRYLNAQRPRFGGTTYTPENTLLYKNRCQLYD